MPGSAGCLEGMATRIVDGDTLYVSVNGTVYKVDLALTKAPSRIDEMFVESTAFTRDLCLGSTVLVDQDDMLLTSNSDIIAVVYCSSSNLNSELWIMVTSNLKRSSAQQVSSLMSLGQKTTAAKPFFFF